MNKDLFLALVNRALGRRDEFAAVTPDDLAWTDAGALRVTFDDGHVGELSAPVLRAACPCAECRGTHGGPPKAFTVLSPAKMAQAARQTVIEAVEPVGHYALCVVWGDGHKDGIFSWPYLRALSAEHLAATLV
ncbi:MAG: DUF971 domain-containing protein [Myxococcales bacterium]|nr:DUF971 domain-containing protein [Myxococcales bacterium]MCB9731633.1 DUF971 domain-containing protein [Deltaproteobacteria bacterium]